MRSVAAKDTAVKSALLRSITLIILVIQKEPPHACRDDAPFWISYSASLSTGSRFGFILETRNPKVETLHQIALSSRAGTLSGILAISDFRFPILDSPYSSPFTPYRIKSGMLRGLEISPTRIWSWVSSNSVCVSARS
jgi:hypothetical protein